MHRVLLREELLCPLLLILYGISFCICDVQGAINPADIDNSGKVDSVDFAYLGNQWLTDGSVQPSADIAPQDGDGVVDPCDLLILANNWLIQENRVPLLYDDFESGFGNYTDGGDDCSLYTGGVYAHQGGNAANIRANSGAASSFWLTNDIDVDTAGFTRLSVEFWYRPEGMEDPDGFKLEYFNGSSWETVGTWRYSGTAVRQVGLNEDFESYQAGDDPVGWLDTAVNNSMASDDSLFKVFGVSSQKAFGTLSTLTNIHSHYVGANSENWTDYEYSGRMRISSSIGGVGVTAFSDYPNSDRYYRLRRYNYKSFYIAPHPDGTGISGGVTDTGVYPIANMWYRFRLQVEVAADRTNIRAKVWQEGDPEPPNWQADCYDSSPERMTSGTVGVWAMGPGAKYWDDLEVQFAQQEDVTGYFQNGQFYFESVTLQEPEYVLPTNMNIRFQCDADANEDNLYIDEIAVNAAGGIGVVLSTPDANAYEKSGAPAEWVIETISDDAASVSVGFIVSGIESDSYGAASPEDYELRDANGDAATGPVTIPVPGHFEIFLYPSDDGIAEPRESAVLSIQPGNYSVTNNNLPVNIYDASNDPANDTLLVAMLQPESNAQTTASGVATIVINGSQTQARVSSSFSGLTSIQTASHLHYANPQDPQNGIGPAIFSLPLGGFSNLTWDITATGGYSIAEIIDALYQQNGLNIYLNVHTASYPAGEIRGPFVKQLGSPEFVVPDPPPAHEVLTGDALGRDVVRFLMQATFGPKQTEIDSLYDSVVNTFGGDRIAAYEAWINEQFALDQTSLETLLYYIDENEYVEEGLTRGGGVDFTNASQTPTWVHWDLALHAHDQLRQRMAFALSEIVVISKFANTLISYVHYGPEKYWDMLASHADGNYFDVLYDVSKNPLMGSYLSHLANQKTVFNPQTGTFIHPDENYAREIMQLFSIGLLELHPDGTLRLGSAGQVLETYDNNDVTELAKVFTGWGLSKRANGDDNNYFFLTTIGPRLNNESWVYPMKSFAEYHDTGTKQVLGSTIPSGLDGEQDLTAALQTIFNHPNIGPFISRRLIQRFVTSNPGRDYVYRVAQAFEDDGTGQRGNLKAVIKAVLLDYEARSLTIVDDPNNDSYGKVKEPIIAFIQLCRAFNMTPDPNSTDSIADLVAVGYPMDQADNFPPEWAVIGKQGQSSSFGFGFEFDQRFMSAPSVFNFYFPDYSPGGDISAAGLFAPELQISDEYTVAIRHRETWEKLYYTTRDWPIDLAQFQQIVDDARAAGATEYQAAEALVDYLDLLLNAGTLKADYSDATAPNIRSIIIDTVAQQSDAAQTGKALTAPYLVITSPAFHVQR